MFVLKEFQKVNQNQHLYSLTTVEYWVAELAGGCWFPEYHSMASAECSAERTELVMARIHRYLALAVCRRPGPRLNRLRRMVHPQPRLPSWH